MGGVKTRPIEGWLMLARAGAGPGIRALTSGAEAPPPMGETGAERPDVSGSCAEAQGVTATRAARITTLPAIFITRLPKSLIAPGASGNNNGVPWLENDILACIDSPKHILVVKGKPYWLTIIVPEHVHFLGIRKFRNTTGT